MWPRLHAPQASLCKTFLSKENCLQDLFNTSSKSAWPLETVQLWHPAAANVWMFATEHFKAAYLSLSCSCGISMHWRSARLPMFSKATVGVTKNNTLSSCFPAWRWDSSNSSLLMDQMGSTHCAPQVVCSWAWVQGQDL